MKSDSRARGRLAPGFEALERRELLSDAAWIYAGADRAHGGHAQSVSTASDFGHPSTAFVAKYKGHYDVGPLRSGVPGFEIYLYGGGTSSAFLHGNLEVAIYASPDPTIGSSGQASLPVKNVSNSGNSLVLDLQGPPMADARTPPGQMTWTVDGASGGVFTDATGQGTVQIHYARTGRLSPGSLNSGSVGVIFRGMVQITGVNNVLNTHF